MNQVEFCCDRLRLAIESDEVPVVYTAKYREFGIRVLDGGTSNIELLYCPWSGHQLPESLRTRWFKELEQRGIDPVKDQIPPEFGDERWYTDGAD